MRAFVLAVLVACTTTRIVYVPAPKGPRCPRRIGASEPRPDAATGDDDDDIVDAGTEAGVAPTRKTTAVMTIEGVKRTLERAQFGRDQDGTLRIEAYEGGDPKCPDETTPSPKRTLIISGVKAAAPGTKETKADGIAMSFLDFTGDQLPDGTPFTKATSASVEIVAIKGAAGNETEIEIEVDATFAEGTAKGRLFAEFCQSLSE